MMEEWLLVIIICIFPMLIIAVGILVTFYCVPHAGKRYSISGGFLHIYTGRNKTIEICLSEIELVTVYHSCLDALNIRLGGSYTVCVNYKKGKHLRFHISKYDAPDFKLNILNQITDYALPDIVESNKKHLIEELQKSGIKVI